MADRLKERLRHAALALLLSAGLVMPLCGALDASLISPLPLLVTVGVILAFEAAAMHRAAAWGAALAAAGTAAFWVFMANGAQVLSDAGLAVSLRLRGLTTAVPLAAKPVAVLTAAVLTLLCCFACLRQATCVPALVLCTSVIMAVWLTDSMELLPWLLPALAAVLTLLMIYRFEDTPVIRVLPWAAALTALAFLLTGSGPAENPLKNKADEIRQAILDRLFFTEARDVFSLYAAGYSPQGADQLGGKPNPSDNPVMQVSTPKTTYLRGTVYNRYDGHGWKNTTGGRRYLWSSRRMEATRSALFDETLPHDSVQNSLSDPAAVSVRMLSGSASTLFVPQRVRELVPGGETVPYFSNSSEIFITRNLQAGDTYEVSAPLYVSTDPGIGTLTEICATLGDSRYESIRNTYTELPSHLEQPVRDLADEVTAGASTPYEKAMALQNYLSRNYRYTTDVGEHPENIDFVTSFLLDTKKGYCTYFASAMTVLCRMAGLPARYVEGYLAEPNEYGEALVTGLEAHAWTEVYFAGFGWLTFDATPRRHSSGSQGGTQPTPTPEPSVTPTPGPTETPEPEPDATPEEDPGEDTPEPPEDPENIPPETTPEPPEEPDPQEERKNPGFPWWILIVLAVLAALALRILTTSPLFREKRAKSEDARFDIWAEEVKALLRAERCERRNGETPMAFARRVDEEARFSESITPAGECLSLIRYSTADPVETDTGLMRDTALLIRGELSPKGRIRYMAARVSGFRKTLSKEAKIKYNKP